MIILQSIIMMMKVNSSKESSLEASGSGFNLGIHKIHSDFISKTLTVEFIAMEAQSFNLISRRMIQMMMSILVSIRRVIINSMGMLGV
jgi:hypothetical protein